MARTVLMEHMRSGELDAAIRACPIVYIPYGVLEYHGPHLPMGCDSFICQEIARQAAERFGGAVFPTTWFHAHFQSMQGLLFEHMLRLKRTGFRVLVVMSTHGDARWRPKVEQALAHALEYEPKGVGLVCSPLYDSKDPVCASDHAGCRETSHMLHLQPGDVDLSTLVGDPPYPGVMAEHPPQGARAELAEPALRIAADWLGKRALEQLQTLPEALRQMSIPAISPEHWWFV